MLWGAYEKAIAGYGHCTITDAAGAESMITFRSFFLAGYYVELPGEPYFLAGGPYIINIYRSVFCYLTCRSI